MQPSPRDSSRDSAPDTERTDQVQRVHVESVGSFDIWPFFIGFTGMALTGGAILHWMDPPSGWLLYLALALFGIGGIGAVGAGIVIFIGLAIAAGYLILTLPFKLIGLILGAFWRLFTGGRRNSGD